MSHAGPVPCQRLFSQSPGIKTATSLTTSTPHAWSPPVNTFIRDLETKVYVDDSPQTNGTKNIVQNLATIPIDALLSRSHNHRSTLG